MARLIPDDIDNSLVNAIEHHGELRTLLSLRDKLPAQYTVYHAVHWATSNPTGSVYGEIDFIIANRYGKLLAIEQKDGTVYTHNQDILVDYANQVGKSVTTQINRNLHALRQEFARRHPSQVLSVDHLLYVPNALIRGHLPVSIDPNRVVDAGNAENLCETIEALFDVAPIPGGDHSALAHDIHDFLSDRVHAVPHIGLLGKSTQAFTSRVSGGLATWASRLTLAPYRLHVRGTAGSGKTQLALQELRLAAKDTQQLAVYFCYNRPLAEAIKLTAPVAERVMTVHEFGKELAIQAGWEMNFDDPSVYDKMINAIHQLSPKIGPIFDVLIIDEAQDMDRDWITSLLTLAKPNSRVVVLDDPEQTLYSQNPFEPSNWAMLESPVNYRSPRKLVDFMNHLQLTNSLIEAGSGILGFDPAWHVYVDNKSLVDETELALKKLLHQGYAPENIALISYKSSQDSVFLSDMQLKGLAGIALKRSLGYAANSQPIYSEGRLLVESLRRFKGQAADAVIITEIDFEVLDQINRRKLFVALSRARLHAVMVTSERASECLLQILEGDSGG